MNRYKLLGRLLFLISVFFIPVAGFSQITSNAAAVVPTEYSSGPQDNIHVFCGAKGELNASLTASLPAGETGSFEWQKYNVQSGTFDFFSSDLSGNATSTISNLADGCYRVKETIASGDKLYTAWVFNNYIEATAEIPESDCTSFTLKGTFDTPIFTYIDLPTGQVKDLVKNIQVKWTEGSVLVSSVITSKIYTPPTKDTNYALEVTDRFGCIAKAEVLYKSIVTKALFSVSIDKGEAPLEVTFTNESENGDPGKFEWFIFRDLDAIKKEAAANKNVIIDSIMVILYNDSPVYTFENSGTYKVKLVSKKVSELNTCYDTVYLKDYIVADTSDIKIPNVFVTNGERPNFVIYYQSMKSMKISIFNRWGKLLHV